MKPPLHIALAYFSIAGLQKWYSLICGVLLGAGLLIALTTSSIRTAGIAMGVALFGLFTLVLIPGYFGGVLLRAGSTPSVLHLRPDGRRQMLLGATLAITLIAALPTLFAAIHPLTPLHLKRGGAFGVSPIEVFKFVWGCTALVWVLYFMLSCRAALLRFSFTLTPLLPLGLIHLRDQPSSADPTDLAPAQMSTMLFAAGGITWILFCHWYHRTSSIQRPSYFAASISGPSPPDYSWLYPGRWFRRSATTDAITSPASAMGMYFSGGNFIGMERTGFLVGTVVTLVLLAGTPFLSGSTPQLHPIAFVATVFPIIGWTFGMSIVRTARMLWLRAGLDRAALFYDAERRLVRATLAGMSIPTLVFGTMAIIQKPGLATGTVLYMATAATLAICLLYVGLATTQVWSIRTILVVIGMIPATIALASLKPDKAHSLWVQLIGLFIVSATALTLRHFARKVWLKLDWRLTGSPLPRGYK